VTHKGINLNWDRRGRRNEDITEMLLIMARLDTVEAFQRMGTAKAHDESDDSSGVVIPDET